MTPEARSVGEALAQAAVEREQPSEFEGFEEETGQPEEVDADVVHANGDPADDAPEGREEEPLFSPEVEEIQAKRKEQAQAFFKKNAGTQPGDLTGGGGADPAPVSSTVDEAGTTSDPIRDDRELVDPVVHQAEGDPQPEQPTHAEPRMAELKALLTSSEFAAQVGPAPEFGPMIRYGERVIPKVMFDLMQAGWLNGWRG